MISSRPKKCRYTITAYTVSLRALNTLNSDWPLDCYQAYSHKPIINDASCTLAQIINNNGTKSLLDDAWSDTKWMNEWMEWDQWCAEILVDWWLMYNITFMHWHYSTRTTLTYLRQVHFYRCPLFEKFLRAHVWTVSGNMHVKFEVYSSNHFGAISI